MGTGIRHPSLVSLAIIIETRCNFEYIESHGASMPPPQEDSCKPILRFYSAHSTRNQARQAIANGHGILQAGVENIPPTALRLTDDPDASGMWTLEIKQEVVSLTLNGFVIQMKAKQPCAPLCPMRSNQTQGCTLHQTVSGRLACACGHAREQWSCGVMFPQGDACRR
ncbi:hypothetical protein WJX79_002691 [Trebouxia sp. C0005]